MCASPLFSWSLTCARALAPPSSTCSGKNFFFFFSSFFVTARLVLRRYEDRLRKCDEMQQLYDNTSDVAGDMVERYIQRNVLKRFGFRPSVDNLQRYWQIRAHYGDDDAELMGSVIYLRYAHLLRDCALPLRSAAPDASLVTLDGNNTRLSDYMRAHRTLVVLAGSAT